MTRPRLLAATIMALALICLAADRAGAAVFQFAVEVETRKGTRLAFLWLPPEAKRVRGIVVGGMTLMERELAKDPRIRAACAREQLAIVFLKCGLRGTDLQTALDRLAVRSGYGELARAPLLFVGHSAGGPQAKSRAIEMADRCLGLVQYRGADPGGDTPLPPGIPALMICGQFDEFGKIGRNADGVENWEKDRDKMVAYRRADPRNLGNFLVEPGAGHFAWSDRCAEYLALFIAKAAAARIPDDSPDSPLRTVEPASGWLSDPSIRPRGKHEAAPYSEYSGDRSTAMWHFDREIAEACAAFLEGLERDDQFISWKDPHRVNAGARNFLTRVRWVDDGRTFVVHPVYAETYPGPFRGRGARWGKAGRPVGKSSAPIEIKPVSGPLVHAGGHRLRVEHDELAPATERARVTFMAFSRGDAQYRYTERVGMLDGRLLRIDGGRSQSITFPAPDDLGAGVTELKLGATSDAGLEVDYHIAYGPAVVEAGTLRLEQVPARARFPIEVKVVAYQRGRGLEPLVQTAEPVVRVIRVGRP